MGYYHRYSTQPNFIEYLCEERCVMIHKTWPLKLYALLESTVCFSCCLPFVVGQVAVDRKIRLNIYFRRLVLQCNVAFPYRLSTRHL